MLYNIRRFGTLQQERDCLERSIRFVLEVCPLVTSVLSGTPVLIPSRFTTHLQVWNFSRLLTGWNIPSRFKVSDSFVAGFYSKMSKRFGCRQSRFLKSQKWIHPSFIPALCTRLAFVSILAHSAGFSLSPYQVYPQAVSMPYSFILYLISENKQRFSRDGPATLASVSRSWYTQGEILINVL